MTFEYTSHLLFYLLFFDVFNNVLRHADQEMTIDKESRNSCDNTFTSCVKQSNFSVGQDDQCNRQNEKRAEEQEKVFIRPPSVQSLRTLSSTTSNSSFTSSFVASNQTFASSLSTSQRPQGDHM